MRLKRVLHLQMVKDDGVMGGSRGKWVKGWEKRITLAKRSFSRSKLQIQSTRRGRRRGVPVGLYLRPVCVKALKLSSWSDYEPEYKLEQMRLVRLQVFHLTQTFP